jgi:hypothetical protein
MKQSHVAKDYLNRSHKEIVAVFTTFDRATYMSFNFDRNFNFNFKIVTSSTVNGLA